MVRHSYDHSKDFEFMNIRNNNSVTPLIGSESFLVILLLTINALSLFPLLTTGYFYDDILNSQIRGYMVQSNLSLWGVTYHFMKSWLIGNGRLFPLAFSDYSFFYLLDNVFLYKLFIMVVILANLGVFYVFIRNFTQSQLISVVSLMLLSIAFQFRECWDPILGFCAQYPLIYLLLFGSLTLFLQVLDDVRTKRILLCVSAFLFMCCGLFFETTYPMFLIYGVVACLRLKNLKKVILVSWPFFTVTLILVIASVILRFHATAIGSPYKMHLSAMAITKSYFTQLVGAIPFSYYFFDPHLVFQNATFHYLQPNLLQILPFLILLLLFTIQAVCREASKVHVMPSTISDSGILTLGALLYILPPALITLSPKYQLQRLGESYLPVYMSYFGLCLIFAVGVNKLHRKWNGEDHRWRWVKWVGFCLFISLFVFNFRNNYLVAQKMNEAVWNARVLTESALDNGLLKNVEAKSVLLINGVEPWDNANLYSQHTGLYFTVERLKLHDIIASIQQNGWGCTTTAYDHKMIDFSSGTPAYTVQVRHLADGVGSVILARLQKAFYFGGQMRGLLCKDVTAYFCLPSFSHNLTTAISGEKMMNISADTADYSMELFRETEYDLQNVRTGDNWRSLSLHSDDYIDALSLRGEILKEGVLSSIVIPQQRELFKLKSSGPELIHVGYQSELGNGDVLPVVTLGDDVSIEIVVTPNNLQVPYADIISNHSNYRGFCIEQLNKQTNVYGVAFGSGKEWMFVGSFTLRSGYRNLISLQLKGRSVQLYVNGKIIANKLLPSDVLESSEPLHIGNWINGDRPFNGWIEEVLIAKNTKTQEMISGEAKQLLSDKTDSNIIK